MLPRGHGWVVMCCPLAFREVCTHQFTELAGNERRCDGTAPWCPGSWSTAASRKGAFARVLRLESTTLLVGFEPEGEVVRRYGVSLDPRGHATGAPLVIDKAGIVRHAEVVATPGTPDEDAVRAALATSNL